MNRRQLLSTGLAAAFASLLAASAHAEPTLVVRGDAACPSADMIRAALFAARPGGNLPQQPIAVDVAGDRLIVSLGEAPAARREIPADPDCAVRAASVAVVVAAWSGELVSRPSDSPTLTPASPPSVLTAVVRPARQAANVIEVDGAVFYSPVWGQAPGASVGIGRTLRDGHAGVRLLGAYQLARDVPLEGGTNEVQRFIAGATVTHRLERRRVFAAIDAGLVGTLTRAQGSGYATNRTASAANFGVVAELRGGLRWGRARLWANARVLRLVQDETVKVQSSSPGVADGVTLRPWDAQLGVGVGFLFE